MADNPISNLTELAAAPADDDFFLLDDTDAGPTTSKKITPVNMVDNRPVVLANTAHAAVVVGNPHVVTKTEVGLGNVTNVDAIPRANHTGTQTASTISDFAATVRATVLTGISFATATAVLATDTILIAIGKLQAQLDALVLGSKVIRTDYIEGTTSGPTTTATTSGTAVVIAEMTDTFTPAAADDVIDVFFSGTFGEDVSGKDETVHIGVFIDGSLVATTERSQSVKGTADGDKISSFSTQWSGSLSVASHTIDVRFWIIGTAGAQAVAITTRRNLIIKETDE